jgi:hypothetical protein
VVRRRSLALITGAITSMAILGGCGGSSGSGSGSVSDVRSCLEGDGYGVTVVPASEVAKSGPENRGPGQTGELLVGLAGVNPPVGSDSADAVVAFFDSAQHAKSAPGTKESNPILHVTAIGAATVQGTVHLAKTVIKQAKSASGARAAFNDQLKKIEGCV